METIEDSLLFMHRAASAFDTLRFMRRSQSQTMKLGERSMSTVCEPLIIPQDPSGQDGPWSVQLRDRCEWDEEY